MNSAQLNIGSRIKHPQFGVGCIVAMDKDFYTIYFNDTAEVKELGRDYSGFEVVEGTEIAQASVSIEDVELALENVLYKMNVIDEPVKLGDRWIRGKMILHPGSGDLQSKEFPIETFFHKIVMLRDRLRVLEQNINSHAKLNDEEKVHLQQYITRCYGSLTSFNILFKDKWAHFKGDSKGD